MNELHKTVDSSPSRSTLRRIVNSFESCGWCNETAGYLQITSKGAQALKAYTELVRAVEQLIEKSTWFLRLPPQDATMPVQELADADLIITSTARSSGVWTAVRLFDHKTRYFRALSSIFDPVLFFSYQRMLQLGVNIEAEVILDLPSYVEAVESRYTNHMVNDSYQSNYHPLVLNHAHTLGIGIYDDRKVAIGAYNENGKGKHIAMIVSTNDRLVEWGINLYESYREQSYRPSDLNFE